MSYNPDQPRNPAGTDEGGRWRLTLSAARTAAGLSGAAGDVSALTWYHNTSAREAILQEGFTKFSNGLFGQGAYLTTRARPSAGDRADVAVRVQPSSTLRTTFTEFPRVYKELTGKEYAGGNAGEGATLLDLGFDSVLITDVDEGEQWLVLLDPQHSVVSME
jgi:hypothetical protein